MNYDRDQLVDQLIIHEGVELKPYKDTLGILTIGIGRNLEDRGISEDEARYLCLNDIEIVERELASNFAIVDGLDPARQLVIADMAFNLGVPRLRGFAKMWLAIEQGDYNAAAEEMLDSKWARQVGQRAQRLAETMRTGEYPTF
jgi:lysozyme